jgi:DNA-binding LacI/PurR family transcriptional regulator/anti-anti-sigma regulatory factor
MSSEKTGTRHTKPKKSRPVIGFLTHTISDAYGALLWAGAMDAAKEGDANLICFPGWALHSRRGFEAQANVLYDLVSAENVDGLVLSSGVLSNYVGPEQFRDFCERYHPLPMASIAIALEGIPSVLTENYQGVREVMVHLIEVHGLRRLAFISGLPGNREAEIRYQAYADALAEYGLPLDPALISPPTYWDDASGIAAMRVLLDERKLLPRVDFEAVVTGSDNAAFGALIELQARGVQVPEDIAVTGFDAQERSEYLPPPLTSVRQPIYEQGRLATEMVLAQLQGKEVRDQVNLPTELVVRQSCGCLDPAVVQAALEPASHPLHKVVMGDTLEAALATHRERILSEMTEAAGAASEGVISEWASQLLEAFVADLEGRSPGTFLSILDRILRQAEAAGGEVITWQGVLGALHRHALPILSGSALFYPAESLWQQAQVMIARTALRARSYRQWQAEQQAESFREIGQTLITTFDMAELMDVIASELPRAGIPSCYLCVYKGQDVPPKRSRLIMAYNEEGRIELEQDGRSFASRRLVPEGLLPRETRYAMVVKPLYFREHQIGFALLEASSQPGNVYEVLRGQLSSALESALLLQERKRAEEALEKAYAEVEKQVEERTAELQQEISERERLQQEIIDAQKQALQELSTPIIPVMDRIIVVPLIGSVDSMRARDVTRSLLAGIRQYRAKVVILDITGVPIVDSGVAEHLNKTIQAARLKGAQTIVTGISDAVAETVVDLGIDWKNVETLSDLQTGLVVALKRLGIELAK